MKIEFLSKFSKDLDKILDISVLSSVEELILEIESAKNINELQNIKKLVGFKNVYRIKLGKYRIGFFYENGVIELARIVHRKDIYKVFP